MGAVDHEQLAVIAVLDALETEARVERRDRVILVDAAARGDERLPPGVAHPHAADGVVDHEDLHALARPIGERLAEPYADGVGSNPVHLEEDLALGVRDGLEHRWKGLDPVAQQAHRVLPHREPGRVADGHALHSTRGS